MAATVTPAAVGDAGLGDLIPFWTDVRRRFLRNKLAVGSVVYVVLLSLIAILAPLITFYGPKKINPAASLGKPSRAHWMGTDLLGRDVWTRLAFGARISLSVALAVVVVSTVLSLLVGALAGYFGGWWDTITMRTADVFSTLPYIVVVLFFISVFGRKVWVIVLAIVALGWMGSARLFRAGVLQVKSQEYIEAARASGCSTLRILTRHVLPNAIQPIIVSVAFGIGSAILLESVFGFLGVGIAEPTPAWGLMVGDARDHLFDAPHLFFFPAGALVLTVLAFTFIGDGLRDALDPKLRGAK